MSTIASCGHQLTELDGFEGQGYDLAVKDYDKRGEPAVKLVVYCTQCALGAYESSLVVSSREQAA